jgi:crotonobetainyl-CoA:carnitine CoA-transferase CaiB-like acyl-CoA transferase
MALLPWERSGEGQEVEVALFETMASFTLVEHANGAMFDPRWGHVARRAPQLGADTAQVFEELGLAPDAEQAAARGSA